MCFDYIRTRLEHDAENKFRRFCENWWPCKVLLVLIADLAHHLFICWPGYFASDSPTLSRGTNQILTLLGFSQITLKPKEKRNKSSTNETTKLHIDRCLIVVVNHRISFHFQQLIGGNPLAAFFKLSNYLHPRLINWLGLQLVYKGTRHDHQ